MAGAVLCHPPGPHPACRTTDTRSSGHLDCSARRVCRASSTRPPRRGSDVAGLSTSERSDHNVSHYAPGFAINKYLCPTGSRGFEVSRQPVEGLLIYVMRLPTPKILDVPSVPDQRWPARLQGHEPAVLPLLLR